MDQQPVSQEPHARGQSTTTAGPANILISRWKDERSSSRLETGTSADEHLVVLCLHAVHLDLAEGGRTVFSGDVAPGALHVRGPSRRLTAEVRGGGCDFILFHVDNAYLQDRLEAVLAGAGLQRRDPDGSWWRDPIAEQLGRTMVSGATSGDPVYAEAVAQTVLTRMLHLSQAQPKANVLQTWRLKRVQALIDDKVSEPLRLADLASAAGLSRMHFAAQFKLATGYSPHEYLVWRRIEAAKTLLGATKLPLVEIALSVGFLAQAHFTTVFKRLVGETPARWRQAHCHAHAARPQ